MTAISGVWPTRFVASTDAPVSCQTLPGPFGRTPETLRLNSCGDSVAFTTESSRDLRSGLSAATMSSGYVGLPEVTVRLIADGGIFRMRAAVNFRRARRESRRRSGPLYSLKTRPWC